MVGKFAPSHGGDLRSRQNVANMLGHGPSRWMKFSLNAFKNFIQKNI